MVSQCFRAGLIIPWDQLSTVGAAMVRWLPLTKKCVFIMGNGWKNGRWWVIGVKNWGYFFLPSIRRWIPSDLASCHQLCAGMRLPPSRTPQLQGDYLADASCASTWAIPSRFCRCFCSRSSRPWLRARPRSCRMRHSMNDMPSICMRERNLKRGSIHMESLGCWRVDSWFGQWLSMQTWYHGPPKHWKNVDFHFL